MLARNVWLRPIYDISANLGSQPIADVSQLTKLKPKILAEEGWEMRFTLRCCGSLLIVPSGCSVDVTPPSSVQVTTSFSDASKQLLLHCEKTSTGVCHVLIENAGKVEALQLRVGSKVTVGAVKAAARTCSRARPIHIKACSWSSVGPT
ncbi:hypothetical protein GCM10022280_09300 [Sphingomonas swuensis]|uniref:Uncharacterized protein n=1 Tax=Sphingomonas swuensis TaxID=977800 RepID=A0ABP7SL94_9SPHN